METYGLSENSYSDNELYQRNDETTTNAQPSSCWYNQPQYDRFWQHYEAMKGWMQSYVSAYRQTYGYATTVDIPPMTGTAPHPFHSRTAPHPNSHWNAAFNSQPVNQSRRRHPAPVYCDDNEYSHDGDSESSMEVEVSQEMMDFFRISQKFREERDRAKAEIEGSAPENRKGKNSKRKQWGKGERKSDAHRAPAERPDEARRKHMKILYGTHSDKIHGMEAAIKMQFDRNCDRFQPALWPVVALKL